MQQGGEVGIKRLRRFLFIELLFGCTGFYGLLNLPASESSSAVWMGLSAFRLVMVILCVWAILFLFFLFLLTFTHASKCATFYNKAMLYLHKHRLFTTALYCGSLLAAAALFSLEILIHYAVLPGAQYYQFLYERVRPLALWAAAFSGHVSFFVGAYIWKGNHAHQPPSQFAKKNNRLGYAYMLLSWLAMLAMWVRYLEHGKGFVNFFYLNRTLLLVSFILLVIPIFLALASKGEDE